MAFDLLPQIATRGDAGRKIEGSWKKRINKKAKMHHSNGISGISVYIIMFWV